MTQTPQGIQPPNITPKRQHSTVLSTAIRRVDAFPPPEAPNFDSEVVWYHNEELNVAYMYVASAGAARWVPVVQPPV